MAQTVISIAFYLLLFVTPLFWTPLNYELFEYNKMILVYFLTTVIAGTWALKCINNKSLVLNRTPLDIPILLFLGANILSTMFSIDPHTSIWGYYSRSNGGLLSIISYTVLFYALVSNFSAKDILKFLKVSLAAAFLAALYGILEHFGIDKDFWVQDVQARVFSTLGQPNWLAAYLAMLIFPAIYFFLEAKTFWGKAWYYTVTVTLYAAFTFTYSRGATLGLLGGFAVLSFLQLLRFHPLRLRPTKSRPRLPAGSGRAKGGKLDLKNRAVNIIRGFFFKTPLALILPSLFAINLLSGSALTGNFRLINQAAAPARPGIVSDPAPSVGTQLENGGTESGQIRLIVWKGALEIFKHHPVFGSGVETFAYSYYQFRPAEHNLVSEWDFLYNKAHNEYLNYLATTGAVGFGTYIALVGSFLIFSIWYLVFREEYKIQDTKYKILCTAILAGYASYLIQNFFGFSVVIIALYFYLFPAMFFVLANKTRPCTISWPFGHFKALAQVLTVGLTFYTCYLLLNLWRADVLFAKGYNFSEAGEVADAYTYLKNAVSQNPGEPFYRSELGFAASSVAVALDGVDATKSAQLLKESVLETENALAQSPMNVSFWRTSIRTYYQLSTIDPAFVQNTTGAFDRSIELAPTDAKLFYNKALVLDQLGQQAESLALLEKAVSLKPNYLEAHFNLGIFYKQASESTKDAGEKDKLLKKALEHMNYVLKLVPSHPEALEKTKEWSVVTK